jgi:hypothetical protein
MMVSFLFRPHRSIHIPATRKTVTGGRAALRSAAGAHINDGFTLRARNVDVRVLQ